MTPSPQRRSILVLSIALGFFLATANQGRGQAAPVPPVASHVVPTTPRLLKPEDFKSLAWRSIGPANMGGRVADICFAPGSGKVFYVAFGTGGLFKTGNGGTTFTPVFDKYETASIGSVVVADAPPDWPGWKDEPIDPAAALQPKDPKADAEKGKAKIIWVGTGEGNNRNSSSWGHGVYRSTDGGGTFTNVGLLDAGDIPRLAVDPRNPDVCYAAALGHLWGANAERGVYKTNDGGKTWNAVLQIDENTGACDIVIDPQNPDTVFAAMYTRRRSAFSFQSGGPNGGIYRSIDAGANWTKLSNGLPTQTGRIGMDISAKDSRILCAVVESDLGGWGTEPFTDVSKAGGVFRSEDHGETWVRVSPFAPRAFYFSKIRIDPTDDQRVYLLGWVLYVSDDGGETFRSGAARKPHVDFHAMVIDPADKDHLIVGTDGGVYQSWDRGGTWDFLNHTATGEFYNIAFDMSDPYRIAGGLQDNGTWIGPSGTIMMSEGDNPGEPGAGITNADWRLVGWGDGFHVAFDPSDPNIFYSESQGGFLVRSHLDTGRRKNLIPSPKEGQPRFRFNWNTPFFISPHDATVLYMGGNNVFKLIERGDKWERISDDLSTQDPAKVQSVGSSAETHGTVVSLTESILANGLLWAGTDDGLIHVTEDDGKTWRQVTPPEVIGRYISKIEASYHDRNTVYVSIDGHRNDNMTPCILTSADLGQSWRNVSGDLPAKWPVKCVRQDRFNAQVLYCGTENAAYVTIDGGTHWVKMNGESLPTVAVDDLQQHPRERDLIAGTHGRSIYVLDDASAISQLTPEIVQSDFHIFDVQPGKPRLFLPYEGLWSERIWKAPNPPMGARITYWVRDYTGDEVSFSITDAKGTEVRKLSGPGKPGLNRVVWDLEPEGFQKMPNPDADLGQKAFVPPGEYKLTATYGKKSASKTIQVLSAPGAPKL